MIKTILVPVSGGRGDEASLRTALAMARLFGGHIEAAHFRESPDQLAALRATTETGLMVSGAELAGALRKQSDERAHRARRGYDQFCSREKIEQTDTPRDGVSVSAEWLENVGDEIAAITARARFRDLLVLRSGHNSGLSSDAVGDILIQAGRPVLLAPSPGHSHIARTIVIAWKDGPEAARAVTAAMPLLYKADKIVVVSVTEVNSSDKASVGRLVEQLRWHGLKVTGEQIESKASAGADALQKRARVLEADLLVMGGYAHSRLRELVFGGFTQYMLAKATLPVFLFH